MNLPASRPFGLLSSSRAWVAWVLLAAAGLGLMAAPLVLLGGSTRGSRPPVRALRYTLDVHESWIEYTHGWKRTVEELFFPEQGIVCNVVLRSRWTSEGDTEKSPVMTAFQGKIRAGEKKGPPEEIEVPADLAEAIFSFVDLTEKQEKKAALLGRQAVSAGVLRHPPAGEKR